MNSKEPTIQQFEATNKAYELRSKSNNDNELAELLGMSKVTLYTRLSKSNWKKPEIALINNLSNSD